MLAGSLDSFLRGAPRQVRGRRWRADGESRWLPGAAGVIKRRILNYGGEATVLAEVPGGELTRAPR